MKVSLAAVVVSYNPGPYLRRCVESLLEGGCNEVVVVDNSSTDGSSEALAKSLPSVRVIASPRNLGYGSAANVGVASTDAEVLLVCNCDVAVQAGAVEALVDDLCTEDDVALVGPMVLGDDGELYPSARTFPSLVDSLGHGFVGLLTPRNPWTRRYTMAGWDHRSRRRVDWVSGACFAVRRLAWETLGGFDERYFMYSEDVDLCWRAARAGWAVLYEPEARVTHTQGVSSRQRPFRMLAEHHRSLLRFADRSTSGPRRVLLLPVGAGLAARLCLAAVRELLARRGLPSQQLV